MNNCTRMLMIMLSVLAVTLLGGCANGKPKQSLNVEKTQTVTVKATVEAVDLKSRTVTLKTSAGRLLKLHAGEEVVNLPQVKPGDQVKAVYSEALAVRMAKPGEVRDDYTEEMGRAKPGSKPGGYGVAETTVTAKIEGLDKTRRTASLRMPDGDLLTVEVRDPANLEKVRVGDTIVITYREALAISLEEAKR